MVSTNPAHGRLISKRVDVNGLPGFAVAASPTRCNRHCGGLQTPTQLLSFCVVDVAVFQLPVVKTVPNIFDGSRKTKNGIMWLDQGRDIHN